jgi:ABC-2 type transport system permease protein
VPVGIIVLLFYREYFIFTSVGALALTIVASIAAFLAFFQLSFSIGCAAFWLDDAFGVREVYWFFIIVFGGAIAPLEFLPRIMQKIAAFLPFKYFHYFPVKLYLDPLSSFEIVQGFLILGFWLIASFFIYKTVWHFGTKRYSAVGG